MLSVDKSVVSVSDSQHLGVGVESYQEGYTPYIFM